MVHCRNKYPSRPSQQPLQQLTDFGSVQCPSKWVSGDVPVTGAAAVPAVSVAAAVAAVSAAVAAIAAVSGVAAIAAAVARAVSLSEGQVWLRSRLQASRRHVPLTSYPRKSEW